MRTDVTEASVHVNRLAAELAQEAEHAGLTATELVELVARASRSQATMPVETDR